MFTVLKAVALRLWMWNISLSLESPKQWLATRLNTACTLCLPTQLCVARVSPFQSVQRITFTTCATTADIYAQVPDFEEELNLRQHIVFAPQHSRCRGDTDRVKLTHGIKFLPFPVTFCYKCCVSCALIFIPGLRISGLAWHVSALMIAFDWQHQPRMKDYSWEGRGLVLVRI